jgi:putative hydrolase of the HAD superfamily
MFPTNTDNIINIECIYYVPISRFTDAYSKCKKYLEDNHLTSSMEEEYDKFVTFYKMMDEELPEFELTDEKIKALAHERVYNPENEVFFDDVHDTLEKLQKKYKLGILADSWPSSENALKNEGLYDLFSHIILSCHHGKYMPNSSMIKHALGRAEISAEQTILIDDSKENLYEAKKHGMQSILINPRSSKKDDEFLTIHTLSDLLEYV